MNAALDGARVDQSIDSSAWISGSTILRTTADSASNVAIVAYLAWMLTRRPARAASST